MIQRSCLALQPRPPAEEAPAPTTRDRALVAARAPPILVYTGMHFRRLRRLRHLTALVLSLSFGFATAESLLADVHDGDATHEELTQVEGSGRHAAAHVAHGDMDEGARIDSRAHPGERSSGPAGHRQHACHHAHAHGGWFRTDEALDGEVAACHESPIASPERFPASRDAQPQLRPPIG